MYLSIQGISPQRPCECFAFTDIPSICPVLSLKDYLVRTGPLRKADSNKMFISLCKPNKCVSSLTQAQQISKIMDTAGVDSSVFCQYSTHSASAAWSETGTKKMSVAQIYRQAKWFSLTTTYRKFYQKVVLQTGSGQKSSFWAQWRWEVMLSL